MLIKSNGGVCLEVAGEPDPILCGDEIIFCRITTDMTTVLLYGWCYNLKNFIRARSMIG